MYTIRINNIEFVSEESSSFGTFKKYYKNDNLHMAIANLEYLSEDECCCQLITMGSRVLDLSKQDREDFFEVYKLAEDRLFKSNQ